MDFSKLEPYILKRKALEATLALWSFDQDTSAPKDSINNTAKLIGVISEEQFNVVTDPKVRDILDQLDTASLSEVESGIVKQWKKDIKELEVIPKDEYVAYQSLVMKSQNIWVKAKNENNYALFKPYLEEIVNTKKRFASYQQTDEKTLYDVLLNQYEEGFNCETLDKFFDSLKAVIVPLLEQIQDSKIKIDDSFDHLYYDLDTQRRVNHDLASYIGFDFNAGIMAEVEHPYTTNFHNKDVRITNHYYDHYLTSALFSTIHETGHALYEMGIRDDLTLTPLGEGKSMGLHESQSRFYENLIGRSHGLWENYYDTLVEAFKEQLGNVSLEQFYLAINKVTPSLIRTEADELTYPLHIMVRYELEKQMINGEVDFDELPQMWNDLYTQYLGVTPSNDSEGILQDVHWAGGMIGYFPSYALGSAIASQIYAHMDTVMDMDKVIQDGNINQITEYLHEHIHQYGKLYTTNELLERMTGESFQEHYYIDYLVHKFKQIYKI